MSLINSLGKHPASNTSCLDGGAATSLAASSLASSSPRPPGARPGQGQGMPGSGCAWPGPAEPGDYVPRGAALPLLASGGTGSRCVVSWLSWGEVLCPGCIPLGTAHTTAVSIPTQRQALLCWRAAFPWEGFLLFHWCRVWEQRVVPSCRRSALSLARDHWCKVRSWRNKSQAQCHGQNYSCFSVVDLGPPATENFNHLLLTTGSQLHF